LEGRECLIKDADSWVTDKIPALNGQTPLEAVRDPDSREKVMALVMGAERSARRMKPPVDPVTLRRVRERLGLTDD
jgi:hypothetical protein